MHIPVRDGIIGHTVTRSSTELTIGISRKGIRQIGIGICQDTTGTVVVAVDVLVGISQVDFLIEDVAAGGHTSYSQHRQ